MSMNKINVKDIEETDLDELEDMFLKEEGLGDPLLIEGSLVWKKWMKNNLKRYSSIGKIAYFDSKIVGMLQYIPKPKHRVSEIKWTFVDGGQHDQEVKKMLLQETIKEFKRPKSYFGYEMAKGLVTYLNPFLSSDEDEEFYKQSGFKEISDTDNNLLFYPFEDVSIEVPEVADLPIDESYRDDILIFVNPITPHCLKEAMKTLKKVRDLGPEIPIRLFAPVGDTEELNYAFSIPVSLVIKDEIIDSSRLGDENLLERFKTTECKADFICSSQDKADKNSRDVMGKIEPLW